MTAVNLGSVGLGGGSIPTSIGGLTGLNYLGVEVNTLSGTIPSVLGLLTNLNGLDLGANTLSGTIPSELGLLIKLNTLYLSDDKLVGPVPASLCLPIKTVNIQIYGNTGLTCYPSCLTNPPYTGLHKDATLTTICPSGK